MVEYVKDSVSYTYISIRLAQSVFSLGDYLLLNKRLIISEFFIHTSKVGVVVLVFKPKEVIRVYVSMYINMLGISIESYGHVLGPPRFYVNFFEKNIFSCKLSLFFNSLIEKIINVIKTWLVIGFFHGSAHFLTQSTRLTQKPTFPKF